MTKLDIGATVDVYACDGAGHPLVKQGRAVIAGYARNECYVVREPRFGTTWHQHASMVRLPGHLLPADWHLLRKGGH